MHNILTLFVATENHSFRARTPKSALASARVQTASPPAGLRQYWSRFIRRAGFVMNVLGNALGLVLLMGAAWSGLRLMQVLMTSQGLPG